MEDTVIQSKPSSRRTKYAMFDYDWTIVKPKEGRKFPKDVDDWMFTRSSVPAVLQKYGKTHHVVIVTDQTKPWKVDQINAVAKVLDLPHLTIIIGGKTHKPSTSLFTKVFPKFKPENAYFVGDAAGRQDDWSDNDKQFAANLHVKFLTPEEVFPLEQQIIPKTIKPKTTQEVIIMVGYPASGKSTIARTIYEAAGYYIVNGDELKTHTAMTKDASKALDKSIVFDSTAGTVAKRHEFVKFAQQHKLPVTAIWVNTPIDVAMERNKTRAQTTGKKIPDVVFYVYRKNFEEPTEAEGFTLIKAAP
jgi:bifunctional polynucleotide phosphatase/kinase